jgi:hypothetical protein
MDKSDKMMDGFLLCDYFEDKNEDYNGIYVSSEDEADEELYYERQLQEQYENNSKRNELNEEELNHDELNEEELNHDELNEEELNEEELNEEELNHDELNEEELNHDELNHDELNEDAEEEDEEEDDDIEIQLEELKILIIQIENKINIIESNNSNMITTTFFVDKKKYNANLHDISILKNKKKEYENSVEFIYKLLIIKNKLV